MVLRRVMENLQSLPRPDVWLKEKVCAFAGYYSSFKNREEAEISHIERTEIRCCPNLLADCGLCCGGIKKWLPKCESPMPIRFAYMMIALFSLVGVLVIPFVVSTRGFGKNQACSKELFYDSHYGNVPCPWHIVEVQAKYELDDVMLILVNLLQLLVCLFAFIFFAFRYEHKIHWVSMLIILLAAGKFIMSGIYGGYMLHTKESVNTFNLIRQVTDQLMRNPSLISQSFMEHNLCCGVESYKDYAGAHLKIPTMCFCNCTRQEQYDLRKKKYEEDAYKRNSNYERYKRYAVLDSDDKVVEAEEWVTEAGTTDRELSENYSEEMVTKPPDFKLGTGIPQNILDYFSKSDLERLTALYEYEAKWKQTKLDETASARLPDREPSSIYRSRYPYRDPYEWHRPSCTFPDSYIECYHTIKVDSGLIINNEGCWNNLEYDLESKIFTNEKIKWITVLVTTGLQVILCLLTCCLKSCVGKEMVDGKTYSKGVERM